MPWNFSFFSGFKLDLVSNLAGSAWAMLVQLACIPLYVRFMGIEAYGLIGFYLMLQSVLQVLDLGLSPTMNREMARYSIQPEKAVEARDLVRTLEVGYWLIGITIGLALVAASPWLAIHWIKASARAVASVRQALLLMGVLTALQWPVSFYQGGLLGLRRQVLFNLLRTISLTLSNGGAVLILWRVSPSIQAFFLWLVATNAVMLVLWAFFLWRCLPRATRAPHFDFGLLRRIGPFAFGMSGITAAALVLTQSDKLILSRVLSLKDFGYYTLAGIFGMGLAMIVSSVFNAIYPRFSALAAQGDERALVRLYHRSTQIMATLILPLAAIMALFSTDFLQLWTKNSEVARNAGPIASLLVIGTALNGMMNLPYALQLAYGWTSLGFRIAAGLTLVFVPSLWFMAKVHGAVGAALLWPALNCAYISIGVTLTHRRLLKGEALRWFGDVSLPFAAVSMVAIAAKGIAAITMSSPVGIVALSGLLVCALAAAVLASPMVRSGALTHILGVKPSC